MHGSGMVFIFSYYQKKFDAIGGNVFTKGFCYKKNAMWECQK